MTHLLRTDAHETDFLLPGGFAPGEESLQQALARADEARADERSKRLAAEETSQRMAELIALEHQRTVAERTARERAEAALALAQSTAHGMAALAAQHQKRAEEAEERARRTFNSYLDDPFRPAPAPPSRGRRLIARLRRS